MGASPAVQAKLGIGTASPVDVPLDFLSETLRRVDTNIEHDGITGIRGRQSEKVRLSQSAIGGSIRLRPCPEEWASLLPWAMGAAAVGTAYALAETVPARYVTIDRIAKVMEYASCYVNRATISAQSGGPVELELDIMGLTETVNNAGTFPSLTLTNSSPFMLSDSAGAFSLASSATLVNGFSLTVDNQLLATFNNATDAGTIISQGRIVTLSVTTPYTSSETALYKQAVGGIAVSAVFTNGNYSLTLTLPKWQVPPETPTVPQRSGEVLLQMNGQGRRSGTTQEFSVTLDSTP